ncbi:hypothetical protein Tsubulata_006652, partial [Turnera subulata]
SFLFSSFPSFLSRFLYQPAPSTISFSFFSLIISFLPYIFSSSTPNHHSTATLPPLLFLSSFLLFPHPSLPPSYPIIRRSLFLASPPLGEEAETSTTVRGRDSHRRHCESPPPLQIATPPTALSSASLNSPPQDELEPPTPRSCLFLDLFPFPSVIRHPRLLRLCRTSCEAEQLSSYATISRRSHLRHGRRRPRGSVVVWDGDGCRLLWMMVFC